MLAEAADRGVDVAEAYKITTVVPYSDTDPEVNTYTKLAQDLNEFFHAYNQTGEIVVDVRLADLREDGDA